MRYGKQASQIYSNLYIPSEYNAEMIAKWDQSADIFVTRMVTDNNVIEILQSQDNTLECDSELQKLGSNNVCVYKKGTVEGFEDYKIISLLINDKYFQIQTNDDKLPMSEIDKIIESLKIK